MNANFTNNPEFNSIKTADVNGTLYFDGIDAAEKLGYSDPMQAINDNVDERDIFYHDVQTAEGKQKIVTINESGYYSLLLSSDTAEGRKLTENLATKILPAIFSYGVFAKDEVLDHPDEWGKAFDAYLYQTLRQKEVNNIQDADISNLSTDGRRARYKKKL